MAPSIASAITPMVLTYNEEANISETLSQLTWASEVLLVDSGSEDNTLNIAHSYPNVRVVERRFDTFATQCNFGLSVIRSPWALSLDADYVLSDELIQEISNLRDDPKVAGFRTRFIYRINGAPLRGALYPPRIVLYRRELATYADEGHGHRVSINGLVLDLASPIFHDDRKPLGRWIASQAKYAKLEADHLLAADRQALSLADKLRLMAWPAPILAGLYVLFAKGCILDGPTGWYYALQRVLAEILLALELLDRRLRQKIRS
jgi:glycosyltransferase involved in cell wall biosynthesis